ncbi:alpha/beta fold hydrolase [Actinoplanes sp. TRM 88003]|uniref:Alpha/beta fold hydrolase n=1 Tax=Paractinoplanes aksuensis TaxID=2939490 RepID=A0ABT1DFB5_9ACTN|nr:alpha/beta fold hydrolase [Actinoplanes aksuensis]MCO8269490.1 alpha/beta fold hydrolase [Actinoplanes aksuensis]
MLISIKPVVVPAPGRATPLRVRISGPAEGRDLPVVLFSHGFGSSLDGYGPLADHWSDHGFVVVQPTHLDSRTLGLPLTPDTWRTRVDDLRRILDHLDLVEEVLGRSLDRGRVAVAGHSFGGQTAGVLLGLRVLGGASQPDPRISRGVLLATAGLGGDDLTAYAQSQFPWMQPDFTDLTTPALVVAGDQDDSPLSVRGPDWLTDAYHLSPPPKTLLTVFGAEHSLGGIPGYEARETTDESPPRVALIQRVTTAYLRGEPLVTDDLGRLESR